MKSFKSSQMMKRIFGFSGAVWASDAIANANTDKRVMVIFVIKISVKEAMPLGVVRSRVM